MYGVLEVLTRSLKKKRKEEGEPAKNLYTKFLSVAKLR